MLGQRRQILEANARPMRNPTRKHEGISGVSARLKPLLACGPTVCLLAPTIVHVEASVNAQIESQRNGQLHLSPQICLHVFSSY